MWRGRAPSQDSWHGPRCNTPHRVLGWARQPTRCRSRYSSSRKSQSPSLNSSFTFRSTWCSRETWRRECQDAHTRLNASASLKCGLLHATRQTHIVQIPKEILTKCELLQAALIQSRCPNFGWNNDQMRAAANCLGKLTFSIFKLKSRPNACCCKLLRQTHVFHIQFEINAKCVLLHAALATSRWPNAGKKTPPSVSCCRPLWQAHVLQISERGK